MADREKIIKGIQECDLNGGLIGNCPYKGILDLLKEQEAVEPKHNPLSPTDWFCGKCGMCISRFHDYCPSCGRKVKWG